jgi:hypothetical protein
MAFPVLRKFVDISNVLGPVPGVDVMAKGPQGWVQCEDHLPYYKDSSCSFPRPRPRPRLHDSRGPRGGGARGPGPARVGLLGLQCSARALFRAAPFKIKCRASHLCYPKALSTSPRACLSIREMRRPPAVSADLITKLGSYVSCLQ